MRKHRRREKGIEVRHRQGCRTRTGGNCTCHPSFRGKVWSARDSRRIHGPWFPTPAQARNWRQDALVGVRKGSLRAPVETTLREAAQEFIEGARTGAVLTRKGQPYAPASVRGYERSLRLYVLPALGEMRLSDVRRIDVQEFTDALVGRGVKGSTVLNILDPLRRIFDRAVKRDQVPMDPTDGLDLPTAPRGRDRIASPAQAARLLAALGEQDRPLWATAIYAGLRRGELRALRWRDVDFDANLIRVERRWDDEAGELDGAKTVAGVRRVPLIRELRGILAAHKLANGGTADAFVFGRTAREVFEPTRVRTRALTAWKGADLEPIGLHECRHTFASLMIAAGINPKALSTYMGHASVSITFDRYGHLMPNAEDEAADLLQAFIERGRIEHIG